ncbi:MAG: glycoside hydrolase family 2 [Actinomycetota bacterium]|nr:glycoside hydrolase family 2 [Actinomycetota bacterium]
MLVLAAGLASSLAPPSAKATAPLRHQPSVLSTPWTGRVSTVAPLPEYPRPQLQRSSWQNLNGRWQYERAVPGQRPPFGLSLPETILVPFPVQSPLSGIERSDFAGWYRRVFQVPWAWRGQHVVLNFGAVSWLSTVYVNHKLVGTHRGDYGAFSLDITHALRRGSNELVVGYVNPVGGAGEPVGKQAPAPPSGFLHSANSGIWQTVWMEPVASAHVSGLELTPDLPRHRLVVSAPVSGGGVLRVAVQALAGGRVVASAQGRAGATISLSLPRARLWWPWDPYLYGLRVTLLRRHTALDRVSSYFGMRSVTLGRVAGARRILLNGRFVFQTGALDQGYWPDGLYAAPTDDAMRFDVQSAKRLGYNMLREHAKVQSDRWYLWADRLGVLVWQDMPNMAITTPHAPTRAARAEFRRELSEIVVQRRSHPSIVTWIPFNEGWQQFDVGGVTRQVKRLDPMALVDGQSGSANCCAAEESATSDIRDTHLYTGPFAVLGDRRASVVGEYGGVLPFPSAGHRWPGTLYSVGNPAVIWPLRDITGVIRRQYEMLGVEMRTEGVSAAIFTELGAYEEELGLVSYDRKSFTILPGLMAKLNARLIAASLRLGSRRAGRPVVPSGSTGRWPLQEGHGNVGRDTSGHGHSLTLLPGTTWTSGRRGGSALALSSRGAAALAPATVIDTTRSFTVSAWLRSAVLGESGTAVSELGTDGSSFSLGIETERGALLQARPGEISSHRLVGSLRTRWTFLVPQSPSCAPLACPVRANTHYDDGRLGVHPGTWHLVTGVFDRPTGTVSVYVDGEPEDVEHVNEVPPSKGPLTVGAGTAVYRAQESMLGAIFGLRTYARSLTPDEVWQLYRAGG